MARPEGVADIGSKSQYNFFKMAAARSYAGMDKEGNSKSIKVSKNGKVTSGFNRNIGQPKALREPATPEHGVNRRTSAGVERLGAVIEPGGGAPNQTPSSVEAQKALDRFHHLGFKKEDLPDKAGSKGAARNELRRDKIKKGTKIGDPIKPDGTAEKIKQDDPKAPNKWRYRHDYRHPSAPVVATPPEVYAKEIAGKKERRKEANARARATVNRSIRGKKKKGKNKKKPRSGYVDLSSIMYRSKFINEDFKKSIDEILGV